MKHVLVVQCSSDTEVNIIGQYYRFIKWFKVNYRVQYMLYATRITIPDNDLKIQVSMDYIAPEDRHQMRNIINEFHQHTYD